MRSDRARDSMKRNRDDDILSAQSDMTLGKK